MECENGNSNSQLTALAMTWTQSFSSAGPQETLFADYDFLFELQQQQQQIEKKKIHNILYHRGDLYCAFEYYDVDGV
jgi:hypothetical protein